MGVLGLYMLGFLFVGAFLTWATEASGSIIKKIGISTGQVLVSSSVVQAISIFSRVGFFSQAFVIAWIVDANLFVENRFMVVAGYYISVFLAIIISQRAGYGVLTMFMHWFYKKTELSNHCDQDESIYEPIELITPRISQVVGYVFLYFGAIFPLLIQLVYPDFTARGVALASLVNGVSTILLIAINETRFAIDIQKTGGSLIPDQLYCARYLGLIINVFLLSAGYVVFFWRGGILS